MQVILLKDVAGTGVKGALKNVSDGYAINFLFPRKLAVLATPQNVEKIKLEKINTEKETQIQNDLLEKNFRDLDGKAITIKVKAGETGHLFAGIHKNKIVELVKSELGIDIPEEFITLDQPIKSVGVHPINASYKVIHTTLNLIVEKL